MADQRTRTVVEAVAAYLERPARSTQPMTRAAIDSALSSAATKTGDLTTDEFTAVANEVNQLLPKITPNITRSGYATALRAAGGLR